MTRILLSLAVLVVLALAGIVVAASLRPDEFRIQRTRHIAAPLARVQPLVAELPRFNTWNPYVRKDPNIRVDYRGPASGPGAVFDFAGNRDVGRGSIRVVDTTPTAVAMDLEMIEPMPGVNRIEFTFVPAAASTDVTWAMRGRWPFVAKVAGLFIDMDAMIGRDFEAGLANLQQVAERG